MSKMENIERQKKYSGLFYIVGFIGMSVTGFDVLSYWKDF